MKNILKISILLFVLGSCLSVSAQKKKSYFQQKYEDAEILVNNGLFDVARTYYVDAYRDARATRQNKKVQNQIKEKIVLMDCYSMYFHLLDQSRELEQLLDMESADKYCTDALAYAEYEHLNIPSIDTLKIRSKVLSQTSELCQNLTRVEFLNEKGDYVSARELFRQVQNKTEMLANDWKIHGFPKRFILKMDSIAHFPNRGRNTVLQYRQVFPDEFKAMENHLYHLLNQKATHSTNPIETDISFVFSLDTNGVLEKTIKGGIDRNFNDVLLKELRNLQMRQPHRYGFTMPAREEVKYHISSTPTDVWVQKTQKELIIKDAKVKKQYYKEFCNELSKAPVGKYCFQIRRNVIDGKDSHSLRITRAKGGKAKKWLKTQ